MSDWEVVQDNNEAPRAAAPTSEWETVTSAPNSRQPQQEDMMTAIGKAPFRAGEDLIRGFYNTMKSIPGYVRQARSEIPNAVNTIRQHPMHALSQAGAGLAELGQNTFNTPHDIVNYLSQRLNLVPQDINRMVQMGRMPDSAQQINQTFGKPQYPGEELIRGIPRNALNIYVAGTGATTFNPFRLGSKSIASEILDTEKKQIKTHNKMYNNIWKGAEKSGFNKVPYNKNLLESNHAVIDKFYPEKSTMSLKAILEEPSLEHAQAAQSDLGHLRRSLEEKARTTPLLETEKALHKVIYDTEKHIENNMFKNAKGEVNNALKNKYQKVTKSYRENVVPYKYNSAIQAYKNNEILPNELVNSLSRGEFAAKKGSAHRVIGARNKLVPSLKTLGTGGLLALAYEKLLGNQPPAEQ